MIKKITLTFLLFTFLHLNRPLEAKAHVKPGIEVLLKEPYIQELKGKKIGLILNHTAVSSTLEHTLDLLKARENAIGFKIQALFAPEHGLDGNCYAYEDVKDSCKMEIPTFSLHGKTRRPTEEMLKGLDLLIYDIQDIGSRSYTYTTTLFYVMEEAAKKNIKVLVLDRPNPLGGELIDGPMLDENLRSMVGYVNVPYCHGMTIGELAYFFNEEYRIHCPLKIIPMDGWKRSMSFEDTGLTWIPTSPQIPEPTTVFYYPTTGMLGELSLSSIGIGYTLPFKIVGAPWIEAKAFAKALNGHHFKGVRFEPFYFRPFFGKFAHQNCEGVLICITDKKMYKPVSTQFLIAGTLKSLYPEQFKEALLASQKKKEIFEKVCGSKEIYQIISEKPYIIWPLITFHENEKKIFLEKRKKYLNPNYT